MYIDIDHLHYVIENKYKIRGRSYGLTFAMLTQAVQSASLLQDGKILIINHVEYNMCMIDMFINLCKHFELSARRINRNTVTLKDNNTKVIFLSYKNIKDKVIGQRFDNFFVDHFSERTFGSYDTELLNNTLR